MIHFGNSLIFCNQQPITVRDVYRMCAAFGGIHEVRFGKDQQNPWLKTADMWTGLEGEWIITADGLICYNYDGVATSIWSKEMTGGVIMPSSSQIDFYAQPNVNIYFMGIPNYTYYAVRLTDSATEVYRMNQGQLSLLCSMPIGLAVGSLSKVSVIYRIYQYSADKDDKWMQVVVYIDDQHVLSHADRLTNITLGNQMGWRLDGVNSVLEWTLPYHPVFNIPVEWVSIDPDETPMAAIERAVGERFIKTFMRNDGSMMVLRPTQQSPEFLIPRSQITNLKRNLDLRAIKTHARVWSAWTYGDYFDKPIASKFGRRFTNVNNPNVFTEEEARLEAENIFHRSRSESDRIAFELPFTPFLEPEDAIWTEDYGTYFVDSGTVSIEGEKIVMQINGRKYTYGG